MRRGLGVVVWMGVGILLWDPPAWLGKRGVEGPVFLNAKGLPWTKFESLPLEASAGGYESTLLST